MWNDVDWGWEIWESAAKNLDSSTAIPQNPNNIQTIQNHQTPSHLQLRAWNQPTREHACQKALQQVAIAGGWR